MTLEQLRKVYEARPFQPFRLLLADGTKIPVAHPDFLWMPPNAARTFWVAEKDGTARIVDLLLVAAIEVRNGKSTRARHSDN